MTAGPYLLSTAPILIGALIAAVIVVIGILWGIRKKRERIAAREEFEARAEEAGVEIGAPQTPPSPVPVAPSPPPIADAPAPGTPPAEDAGQPQTPVDEPPLPGALADEPIAAVVMPDGAPATLAADADAPAGFSPADGPVTQLKGLGPKVAARLAELGVDRIGQIAALDDAAVAALDVRMGPFTGRITRDRWVEQARLLAAGDREGFERVFGRL